MAPSDNQTDGRRSAVVVGAGIGGLAAATALTGRGWRVTVLERESSLDASGAALAIWPNGTRALSTLGVAELVQRAATRPMNAVVRTADGRPLIEHHADELRRRFGAPLVAVRREEVLLAQYGRLEEGTVLFDCAVTRVGDGTVELVNGAMLEADLIIGADGLGSRARVWVAGAAEPRPSGLVAFRGLTQSAVEAPLGEWWGPGVVAGLVPLHDGGIYWYVSLHGDRRTELSDQLDAFAAPLGEVVRSTPPDQVLVHELFDRGPRGAWSRGRVVLIGDAAHAMLPFLGQGACSALEDAVTLADELDRAPTIEKAIQQYVRLRRPSATRLVRGSRLAGQIAMLRSPAARALRDAIIGATPGSFHLRRLDPVLGRASD